MRNRMFKAEYLSNSYGYGDHSPTHDKILIVYAYMTLQCRLDVIFVISIMVITFYQWFLDVYDWISFIFFLSVWSEIVLYKKLPGKRY